jgi:predicted nuclease of restriction endonuclease-like RecB superfamily
MQKPHKDLSPDVRKNQDGNLKPAGKLIQQFQSSISVSKQEFKIEVSKIVEQMQMRKERKIPGSIYKPHSALLIVRT